MAPFAGSVAITGSANASATLTRSSVAPDQSAPRPTYTSGRFESRIASLKVTLIEATDKVSGTLRLRVDALLRADPAPEPIAFDTVVDLVTKNVTILEKET